jgi:putative DNA methylase
MSEIKIPKKLIEVALPLDDINAACVREKSIRHGHPSTLHLWWARRPLAAARAVLFAQLVNDPGYERNLGRGVNKEKAAYERERLFGIIRELVKWENTNNEKVINEAREEIWKSWRETCELNKNHPKAKDLFNPEKLPAFHDPFAGGGTIPLEAQRLGLEANASDLNPVAVTINKAMIEMPPKFANRPPVGPRIANEEQSLLHEKWTGSSGLAEDVRRYGTWINEEAYKRIGKLYPQVEITKEMAKDRPDLKLLIGRKFTAIAWIWARSVKSPNPAFSNIEVPLTSTFMLSSKEGREAYIDPVIEKDGYRFTVRIGKPKDLSAAENGTKFARSNFKCLMSGVPITADYIKAEGRAGRISEKLLAIVAEGDKERIFLSPSPEQEEISHTKPIWQPDVVIIPGMSERVVGYGYCNYSQLFTPRQLTALSTFSDLVQIVHERVKRDALEIHGKDATSYADAMCAYLALAVGRCANYWSSFTPWGGDFIVQTFGRQSIPMIWDHAEGNPFSSSTGNWLGALKWIEKVIIFSLPANGAGNVQQFDAQNQSLSINKIISTDPPYYDNIGYAELSDFFYIWLRRSLKAIFPNIFATLASPKTEELVATPQRHGSKRDAEIFFLEGMTQAMHRLADHAHPAFPVTIYYAFKQSESSESGTSSTGWETFLGAVLEAGFTLTGTWPMRTEREQGLKSGNNYLASSIILVCRQRDAEATTISRRDFIREINITLPEALLDITLGGVNSPIAPVDLSQAIIGPGMAIFSKYKAVLEADGKPMSVRTALQIINRFLSEDDFDHDTQFCLHWFENYGWSDGLFGDANTLAQAKGTSVDGVRDADVIEAGGGRVRLLRFNEYPSDWSPETDGRTPVWEALHHLIRALQSGGESAAGDLLAHMPARIESIRQLAYRLYTLCERKGWAEDARSYNELITSWEATEAVSLKASKSREKQIEMEL